jgi:HD superfamily phosphohydrolase
VDVDKLDYLARDAYFCGTKIGSIDTEFLLNSLRLSSQLFDDDEKSRCYIEIRGSAIPAFEQILISRKQMFNRVYYHRVNLAFDKIMEKVVEQLVLKGAIGYPKDYQSFVRMTDEWLEDKIRDVLADERFKNDQDTIRFAQMYLTRTMPKRVKVGDKDKEDEIVPHYRLRDRIKELKKLYKDDRLEPDIVTAPLKEMTKLERDIKTKESDPHIIRIKPDTVESQAISISYVSDLLRSSLWRDVSTRVIVFQPYAKSAEERHLAKKVALLPHK